MSHHKHGLCQTHYNHTLEGPRGLVDASATIAHINALKAAGMSNRGVAKAYGATEGNVRAILGRRTVRAKTEAQILAIDIPQAPHDGALPGAMVPALGSTRRVQSLIAMGWTRAEIARRVNVNRKTIRTIATGTRVVRGDVARRIDLVFQHMHLEVPPKSREASRARNSAKGWAPALAWDEDAIDDPLATPDLGAKTPWTATYQDLKDMGVGDRAIAERMGCSLEALQKRLSRLERAA